ncbi:MAG: STT3 domain-containing protein [Thermodesulfobacteriota bacterium]
MFRKIDAENFKPAAHDLLQRLLPVCFACLLAYFLAVGIRLLELPFWDHAAFSFNNEPLMGTHDAYGWMAGAKGIGRWADQAMCGLLSFLHTLTGLSIGTLNFWLPAFVAPLAVVPACLLCAYWGYAEAGLTAGFIAAASFGFLLRTRLGFGDTDILTLFFPLFLAAGLVWWLTPITRSGWVTFKKAGQKPKKGKSKKAGQQIIFSENSPQSSGSELFSPFVIWRRALLVGLVFSVYMWFYPSGFPVAIYTALPAIFILIVLKKGVDWDTICGGLAIILSFGKLGWTAWLVSLALLAAAYYAPIFSKNKRLGMVALFIVLILYPVLKGWYPATQLINPILSYAKISSSQGTETLLSYPSVKQSIREVQNIDFSRLIFRTGIHWAIFMAGFLGLVLVIWHYPPALVFCPLLLLACLSFKLGNRFSMYGGPVIGIGLGVGLSLLLHKIRFATYFRWLAQLILIIPIAWLVWNTAHTFRPGPIIPRTYAQTLSQTRQITPVDAQLWQWWDYGFAAQYYAERYSFGDGVAHYGPYLYPLALVHSTSSALQANQVMKYTAQTLYTQIAEERDNQTDLNQASLRSLYFTKKPLPSFSKMKGQEAEALIQGLAIDQKEWPDDLPPLYLIFSWENMKLAYWISFFGNWDLAAGKGRPGKIQKIGGKVKFDMKNGTMQTQSGRNELKSIDVIQGKDIVHHSWPAKNNIHAIVNELSQEVYIMDGTIYRSMMIQMLIKDPGDYQEHFELVIDNSPWTRVYRVK